MIRLLRIEWLKLKSYPVFWIMTSIYVLCLAGCAYGLQQLSVTFLFNLNVETLGLYEFPTVYQTVGYASGFFFLFMAMIMLVHTTNEYTYKTMRQGVINGMSKGEVLMGKLSVVLVFSLVSTFVVAVLSVVLGYIFTEDPTSEMITTNLHFIPAYFVQVFTFLTFAMMVGFLVKRTGLAIGVILLYYLIAELVIVGQIDNDAISRFLPAESIRSLIANPLWEKLAELVPIMDMSQMDQGEAKQLQELENLEEHGTVVRMGIAFAWSAVFTWISYLLLKKRDV